MNGKILITKGKYMRTCKKCRAVKQLEDFGKKVPGGPPWASKDGISTSCNECTKKRCTQCGVFKKLDDFGNRRSAIGGKKSVCKVCFSLEYNPFR